MGLPTATVRMRGPDGIMRTATGMGTGPFDAATKAIDFLVRVPVRGAPLTTCLSNPFFAFTWPKVAKESRCLYDF